MASLIPPWRLSLVQPLSEQQLSVGSFSFSANTQKVEMLFTLPTSDTISAIKIRINSGAINARIGIQTVSGGNASGTYLGGGNAFQDVVISAAGTYTATLGATASLTAGTIYAVVIEVTSGTPTAASIYSITAPTANLPSAGTYNGTTWSKNSQRPVVQLVGALQNWLDFIPAQTTVSVANGNEIAQLIQFPAGTGASFSANALSIVTNSIVASGSVDILLYSGNQTTDTTSSTLTSAFALANINTTANTAIILPLVTPAVFVPGNWYRLSIKNNSGSAMVFNVLSFAATADMNLGFGNAGISTRSGGAGNWTDTATQREEMALYLSDITPSGLYVAGGMVGGMRG